MVRAVTSPANSVSTESGRYYRWKGEEFPSVTSIISVLSKPFLVPWAAKMVAERAQEVANELPALFKADPDGTLKMLKSAHRQKKETAADMGSLVHAVAEAYAKGVKLPPYPPEAAGYVRSLLAFCEDNKPDFTHIEATVYSRKYGYAGTADWFGVLGKPCVADWKTSKAIYPEVALQLAAYAHADFIGFEDEELPLPLVEEAFAVHLRKDGYTLVPVRIDAAVFNSFRNAIGLWRWQKYGAPGVLGESH